MKINLELIVLAASLFACGVQPERASPPTAVDPAPAVQAEPAEVATASPVVLASPVLDEPAQISLSFNPLQERRVTEVRAVVGEAKLPASAESVALEFVSPDGRVFARKSFEPGPSGTVSFSLPVAGTLIDSSALSGTWRLRALVDGSRVEQSFELEQG